MELLKAYLKERRLTLAAFLLFVGVFAVSFALYGLPLAAVGYPAGLCVLLGACLAAWDYGRAARRHKALKRLREAGEAVLLDLPAMTTVEGADCAAVVETLRRELCRQETARAARWEDMTAYYTAWVHQIKTPIAAMRLTLQGEDTPAARRLMTELGRVEQGEYVAIMGESGSGKTTLLNILAALDEPTAGTVRLDGHELGKIRERDAAAFRRDNLGFVFQEFNLLDTFTLEDNIYLPLVLMGRTYEDMRARLLPVARELGLTELLKKYPYEVSGGQKQRAAVARAIITEPKLLLADEPTGALDSGSTDELLRLFAAINRAGQTILMVTHSVKAASRAGRVLFIKDGQVFHQLYRGEDDDTRFYQRISDTLTMLQSGGEPA